MKRSLVVGMLLVATVLGAPLAQGVEGICAPPRCVEHAMTLDRYTFRFNVLLPPGYDERQRRYPVLYLFMGGAGGDAVGHNYNGWLLGSDLVSFTGSLLEPDQAIVVLPDHGVGLDSLDGTMKWETFQVAALIPFIDGHYRTIPDRAHRATAGLSQGGFVAAHNAARHPDVFSAVGSFSGAPIHLSDPVWARVADAASLATYTACPMYGGANDGWLCGGYNPQPGSPIGPLGTYATNEVWWRDNDPTELAANLGGVFVYIGAGNGVPCDELDVETLTTGGTIDDGSIGYHHLEGGAMPQATAFSAALTRAGVAHTTDLRSCGVHSFRYFSADLKRFWPQMIAAFGEQKPRPFDFRAAESRFSIHGWTFEAEGARATEFLDLADASCDGVGLSGSGRMSVTTSSCFEPGEKIIVRGGQDTTATADAQGRITFPVDLGPPHEDQQFTPVARALEAAGGYWTSKAILFEEEL